MEVDSGADSVSSTPRASKLGDSVVRLMCSFGGKILPRPHDNQLRYVGGDTRIVALHRTAATYSTLVSKLSKLVGGGEFTVKYQLPNEDLDALITVSCDEDVENMLDEFDRHQNNNNSSSNNNNNILKVPRLRLFLFPDNHTGMEETDNTSSRANSIASLLDGSRKRENWFLDALNGGAVPSLERRRSEASSIVSEVPDYLFGLDNSDETVTKLRNRVGLGDGVPGSDPGSPAFGSSSSVSQLPSLPPVKTKLENPNPNQNPVEMGEPVSQQSGGQVWGPGSNPGSPYPVHHAPVQSIPVYYVQAGPGQGLVQHRTPHLQPVQMTVQVPGPIPGHFVQQYGQGPVQMPVGYPGSGPIYGAGPMRPIGGMDHPYEIQMQGNMGPGLGPGSGSGIGPSGLGQQVYYGVKNAGFPGMVIPVSTDEVTVSGLDPQKGRIHQP
ncbi:hypothetical protein RND81_07G139800 [Saponaria officinalis]|uniref:PB1 domain-containing protein n=1 Tax=Saponaria officinalis TaxID=3572 RepID=A0AAW1JRS6_SAPOF